MVSTDELRSSLGEERRWAYPAHSMRPLTAVLALIAILSLWPTGTEAALSDAWRSLPASLPTDSIPQFMRILESRGNRGADAAGAAFALGQFHFARGEYAQASSAFSRAAGRSGGNDRGEVRYWAGLAHLALAQPTEAREAFEEASRSALPRRALARLGVAQALEAEGRAPMALDELRKLLAGDAGEAGPAALTAYASLAERAKRPDDARQARARLLREYPASVEAARLAALPLVAAKPAAARSNAVNVQIGAFSDLARANALAESARRAGFGSASVDQRPSGPGRIAMYVVRLGGYADVMEARAALDKAERTLGVSGQVVTK